MPTRITFPLQMTRVKVEFDDRPAVNKAFGTGSAGHRDSHYQFYLPPRHAYRARDGEQGWR
jgi:hypothetical protein